MRLVPQLLESVDQKGLVTFASDRVTAQLQKTDIAPLVGNAIETFTKDGRTQKLLDEVIKVLDRFFQDDETISVMRAKVQKELPVVANIFRADAMVLNRILGAITELLSEVRDDPVHPLRDEFEVFLKSYVRKTKQTKTFARRVEAVKQQLLDRPELGDVAQDMWDSLRCAILNDVEAETSQLAAALTDLLVDVGESLKADAEISADINAGMVTLLANLVEEQRSAISGYIAEQVRTWDMQQLITLIEVNVGRDLQFIRFNGMLIGGCVGVCLYVIERLLLH